MIEKQKQAFANSVGENYGYKISDAIIGFAPGTETKEQTLNKLWSKRRELTNIFKKKNPHISDNEFSVTSVSQRWIDRKYVEMKKVNIERKMRLLLREMDENKKVMCNLEAFVEFDETVGDVDKNISDLRSYSMRLKRRREITKERRTDRRAKTMRRTQNIPTFINTASIPDTRIMSVSASVADDDSLPDVSKLRVDS
jgi:chromosome segregation ATPase